jgi:hypothetical protein
MVLGGINLEMKRKTRPALVVAGLSVYFAAAWSKAD